MMRSHTNTVSVSEECESFRGKAKLLKVRGDNNTARGRRNNKLPRARTRDFFGRYTRRRHTVVQLLLLGAQVAVAASYYFILKVMAHLDERECVSKFVPACPNERRAGFPETCYRKRNELLEYRCDVV